MNVMEHPPFIFKVSDLGELIGKLEGIYLRGRKRRRGKALGSVSRDYVGARTLDRKKMGARERPDCPQVSEIDNTNARYSYETALAVVRYEIGQ